MTESRSQAMERALRDLVAIVSPCLPRMGFCLTHSHGLPCFFGLVVDSCHKALALPPDPGPSNEARALEEKP